MQVKVCGITSMKQLRQLDGLEVDFAGLVFFKQSRNYVSDKISKGEIQDADLDIKKVGVFVNAPYDEIMQTVEDFALDVVQLHGDETAKLCEKISDEVETIKTFRIDEKSNAQIDHIIKDYDEVCDYYLFESAGNNGIQKQVDWKKIGEGKIEKPFFVSGGIGPGDAALIRKFSHPDYFGIDINGLFEKAPGEKDMGAILRFLKDLK